VPSPPTTTRVPARIPYRHFQVVLRCAQLETAGLFFGVLHVAPKQERVMLPSQDLTRSGPDAFLLIATGTAMANRCVAR
jgi:hypothetical protein